MIDVRAWTHTVDANRLSRTFCLSCLHCWTLAQYAGLNLYINMNCGLQDEDYDIDNQVANYVNPG